ncbi:hypothetical protein [Rhodoblastus sp.]|uniref:hypothetical protein n=1 Tax=Rhodoblastus sp. TaxID=1962975 RepID=UPI003F9AD186
MPHEILKAMRALREDLRQRLLQSPEYRALLALDRSIDEIGMIMGTLAPHIPEATIESAPAPEPMVETPQQAPAARSNGIASVFAETLAAKMDQRHVARPASRALAG